MVNVFLQLEYSWIAGISATQAERMTLDQGKIRDTLELMGIKRRGWPDVFDGLKAMEQEAIAVLFKGE